MLYKKLRERLWGLLREFPENNLGSWTSGNASVRDRNTGYIAIKPSGIPLKRLNPKDMAILDLNGEVIDGSLKPSSDSGAHLYIYRHLPHMGGIIHTHSPYATSFAVVGKSIPFCLTELADITKWEIRCSDFVLPGGENIGKVVVENIGNSPAILLKNHGVIAIGSSGEKALNTAIFVEHSAYIYWLAEQVGKPALISLENVSKIFDYHTTVYGQSNDR